MKKYIVIVSVAIVSLCAFVGCGSRGNDRAAEGTEERSQSEQSLNISVYLDLSDRLVRGMTPSQTYRDTAIVNHLVDIFKAKTLEPNILKSKNRMKVFFYPAPADPGIAVLAEGLDVDIAKKKGIEKRDALDAMKGTFQKNLAHIYDQTIQQKNWVGCDIWDFFQNKNVDNLCVSENTRNIIVILTDGYLYAANHKIKAGDAYSYILPQTLAVQNSSLLDKRKGGLKGKNVEVLMLEVNPYSLQHRDKMVEVIKNWFEEMGIEKCYVHETDANLTSTFNIIDNFMDQ
ncbi:MAG: hypothetical protein NC344_10715 [Bacteroidales bacterium]|nr:hypothetical protein [Bacteroidales bacterium]MCM1148277.1 hypothetical protein [Bacteroidales bacterium]MCM1206600.1 hypothetical protein [Bacillota bacterium]MCM1510498.1 hypothetical protein [Clostridium sp.]